MKFIAKLIILLSVIFSMVVLIVSCQSDPENINSTEEIILVETEVTPTEVPTEIPIALATEIVDECLDCHLDKERLIDSAKSGEILESENEGEG